MDEAWKTFVLQHNMSRRTQAGEIQLLFNAGIEAHQNGLHLAACLCYIAGIEFSLRLPLIVEANLNIDDAYPRIPVMSAKLLQHANWY